MNQDLIYIKKYYGEKMMHLCRNLFPTILEQDGLLFNLLKNNFAYSKYLYEDITKNNLEENFKKYIFNLLSTDEEKDKKTYKTPFELMDEASYTLYECKTEEEIRKFKKYYAHGEALCTFRGGRLNRCHVFFAVKKNIDEIKREDFSKPERQDEYGTSVISIQFTKGDTNTLSIKNRYNHRVSNPDATFSNNLENIISGLTDSFEKVYGFNINQNESNGFEIPGYIKANDGKYYKYNYEINNIYYCPGNIIIDNFEVITDYEEKEKYLIVDYFIIDLVDKKISLYKPSLNDSFINGLKDIKKIEITKLKESKNKSIIITLKNGNKAIIKIDKYNRIISYRNDSLETIEDNFLRENKILEELIIPNVTHIANNFLNQNNKLKTLNLPNVIEIENSFLLHNNSLEEINLPNLEYIGNSFLGFNKSLETIKLPNVSIIGSHFLGRNDKLKNVCLPKVRKIGNSFLYSLTNLDNLELPCLESVGETFLYQNTLLNHDELKNTIYFENLESIGSYFLHSNSNLETIILPKLKSIGSDFLYSNSHLKKLTLPELVQAGHNFLFSNNSLIELIAPKLKILGKKSLYKNTTLVSIFIPNLIQCGSSILPKNKKAKNKILKL